MPHDAAAPARIDLMVAIAAGPLAWRDAERPYAVTERGAAIIGLLGLACTVTAAVAAAALDPRDISAAARVIASLVYLGGFAAASHQLWLIARGRHWAPRTVWAPAALRVVPGAAAAVAWPVLVPVQWFPALWPVGLIWGATMSLTLWAIGSRPIALTGLRRLGSSPVTAGVFAAFVVFLVAGIRTDIVVLGLAMLASLALFLGVTALTVALLDWADDGERQMMAVNERAVVAREHRRRAQWVHDRVCAEVRRLRLLHATDAMTLTEVGPALDELDHRFRLIQLDELITGGEASVADLLQPFVRDLQNHHVTITEVPTADESDMVLAAPVATQVRQVLANLCSNALNAGATRVGIRVRRDDGHLVVAVTDDAGGFDHAHLPAGRGLDRLRRQLGSEALTLTRTDGGMLAECRIDLGMVRA